MQIRIMRHLVVNDLLFRLMETDSMKMFSLYNRKEPLERLIKKAEGESSGIVFANVHCYSPRETHEVNEHANHEEIFVSFQGSGRLITGNEEREVFGGGMLVFKPEESHGFKSNEIDPFAYLCIGIKI